jgi:hypothetical protein
MVKGVCVQSMMPLASCLWYSTRPCRELRLPDPTLSDHQQFLRRRDPAVRLCRCVFCSCVLVVREKSRWPCLGCTRSKRGVDESLQAMLARLHLSTLCECRVHKSALTAHRHVSKKVDLDFLELCESDDSLADIPA